MKESKQIFSLFPYYTKWIADFSTEIRPLKDTEIFPMSTSDIRTFEKPKKDLGDVTLMPIDEDQSFVEETDVSTVAIIAKPIQNWNPVAFFSRTLNKPQNIYLITEREAMSIVKAIKYCRISWEELTTCDCLSIRFFSEMENQEH